MGYQQLHIFVRRYVSLRMKSGGWLVFVVTFRTRCLCRVAPWEIAAKRPWQLGPESRSREDDSMLFPHCTFAIHQRSTTRQRSLSEHLKSQPVDTQKFQEFLGNKPARLLNHSALLISAKYQNSTQGRYVQSCRALGFSS